MATSLKDIEQYFDPTPRFDVNLESTAKNRDLQTATINYSRNSPLDYFTAFLKSSGGGADQDAMADALSKAGLLEGFEGGTSNLAKEERQAASRAVGELFTSGNYDDTIIDFLGKQGFDTSTFSGKSSVKVNPIPAQLPGTPGAVGAQSTLDIITDPVTGNKYSRDTAIPGSTYAPYSPSAALATASGAGAKPPVTSPGQGSALGVSAGTPASSALSSLGINLPEVPSSQELLDAALGSPEFKLASDRIQAGALGATAEAEASKESLRKEADASTDNFIESMGRRGLFFSGETKTGIQNIADSLATSIVGADRKLAQQLLESDFDLRETVFNMVESVAKDAAAGRKEALDALEKVGLTVVGDKVVPTLAGRAQTRLEQQADIKNELDQAKFELSTAKTLQAMENAQIRLELAEERALRAASSLSASDKKSQAAITLYDPTITDAILNGLTPQDALNAANTAANNSGVILGVEEQSSILNYAMQLQGALKGAETEDQTAQLTSQFLNAASGVQNSFFGNLFGTTAQSTQMF